MFGRYILVGLYWFVRLCSTTYGTACQRKNRFIHTEETESLSEFVLSNVLMTQLESKSNFFPAAPLYQ